MLLPTPKTASNLFLKIVLLCSRVKSFGTLEIAWERYLTSFNPSPTTSCRLWAKQDSLWREPRGKFLSNGSPTVSSSSSLSSERSSAITTSKAFFHVRCVICDNKFYLITYIVFFQYFIKCSYNVFSTVTPFESTEMNFWSARLDLIPFLTLVTSWVIYLKVMVVLAIGMYLSSMVCRKCRKCWFSTIDSGRQQPMIRTWTIAWLMASCLDEEALYTWTCNVCRWNVSMVGCGVGGPLLACPILLQPGEKKCSILY